MGGWICKAHQNDNEDRIVLLNSNGNEESSDDEETEALRDFTCRDDVPFSNIHNVYLPFSGIWRNVLIPNHGIHIKIVDAVYDSSSLMNPYLYTIEIEHGPHKWTLRYRYKDFHHLHNKLQIYHASRLLHLPIEKHKQKRKYFKSKGVPPVPNFPYTPEVLVSKVDLPERKNHLEKYLQSVVKIYDFRFYHDTLEFLGISPLSFITELGCKRMEGFVEKKSGGYVSTTFAKSLHSVFAQCCRNWTTRWMILKDNFVAYIKPSDGHVKCVMLMDHAFKVNYGKLKTGKSEGLVISNLSRQLYVKCRSERQAAEWREAFEKAISNSGFEFIKKNKYESYAPPRPLSKCRWIIDGATYFESIATALDNAKEEIFIADWWLTPEFYLKRPIYHGHYWQLDYVLKRKAVLRHPSKRGGVLLWAHHEKIVCIDQTYAFVGGLDICYGRWDDYQHRLSDLGEVEERLEVKRHTSSIKSSSLLKKSFSSSDLLEQCSEEKGQSDLSPIHGFREKYIHPLKTSKIPRKFLNKNENVTKNMSKKFKGTIRKLQFAKRLQILDESPSVTSSEVRNLENLPTPADLHRTIQEIALVRLGIERKFRLWQGKDYTNFICKDIVKLGEPYSDCVNRDETPRMPWHDVSCFVQGAAARDVARHFIQRWNFTKQEREKENNFYPHLLPKSYENLDYVSPILSSEVGSLFTANCQILRSSSLWSAGISITEHSILNAYVDAITNAHHFIYIENQFFVSLIGGHKDVYNGISESLYQRILKAHRERELFRVYVVMPLLPAFEGEVGTGSGTLIQAVTHWNYSSICRGPYSLFQRLAKTIKDPLQYISFYGLRNYDILHDVLVTELIYVHSKLMIVDDNIAIIGSANINDRSLLGRRDSEIAIIVQDTVFVNSVMGDQPYDAGKFCSSLRMALFREHLGLLENKLDETDLRDPVSDTFFRDIWLKTASLNTAIYETVFHCIPTDKVRNFPQLRDYQSLQTLALTDREAAIQKLGNIQGYLVLLPYYFLCEESLTPSLVTKEGLLPCSVFT